MKKLFAVILTLFATVAVSSNLYGHDGLEFEADLSGANVVPACTSPAEGEGEFNYNPATKLLSYEIEFEDLLAPDLAAHIHLPALPGAILPPMVPP